jgi:surfactin synthase thioesterase subunit
LLARARLFCFPHAGGGAAVYRLWPAGLPHDVDVCAIQLPGHETRVKEPPLTTIASLVEALVPALRPFFDLPFAFFGHSMGAVVAAEVARALVIDRIQSPSHLVVSSRRAPHLPDPEPPLRGLADDAFVAELDRRYGGLPSEITSCRELMELFLPTIRADVAALETHRPQRRTPLTCPISAFGGSDDRLIAREDLDAWRHETSGAFRVRVFRGDHFYLHARRDEVLADLSSVLAPLTASLGWESVA